MPRGRPKGRKRRLLEMGDMLIGAALTLDLAEREATGAARRLIGTASEDVARATEGLLQWARDGQRGADGQLRLPLGRVR